MTYLLDTGALLPYLKGRTGAHALLKTWVTHQATATSILVYGEICEYLKSQTDTEQRRAQLRALINQFIPAYNLTYAIMERYAELRRALRPPYGPGLIGDIDTLIAATAIEHNCTLVTADSDYLRVPGLTIHHITPQSLR